MMKFSLRCNWERFSPFWQFERAFERQERAPAPLLANSVGNPAAYAPSSDRTRMHLQGAREALEADSICGAEGVPEHRRDHAVQGGASPLNFSA
jgi:hypothetical protein